MARQEAQSIYFINNIPSYPAKDSKSLKCQVTDSFQLQYTIWCSVVYAHFRWVWDIWGEAEDSM